MHKLMVCNSTAASASTGAGFTSPTSVKHINLVHPPHPPWEFKHDEREDERRHSAEGAHSIHVKNQGSPLAKGRVGVWGCVGQDTGKTFSDRSTFDYIWEHGINSCHLWQITTAHSSLHLKYPRWRISWTKWTICQLVGAINCLSFGLNVYIATSLTIMADPASRPQRNRGILYEPGRCRMWHEPKLVSTEWRWQRQGLAWQAETVSHIERRPPFLQLAVI